MRSIPTFCILHSHVEHLLHLFLSNTRPRKGGPGMPAFLRSKLVRCVEHDTKLMNREWEIRIEAAAFFVWRRK